MAAASPRPPLSDSQEKSDRIVALFAAVLHHGMSNLAPDSVPPHSETVLETANNMYEWINGNHTNHHRRRR
jgi:hypothetical protein